MLLSAPASRGRIDQLDAAAFGPTNCSTSSCSIRRTTSSPTRSLAAAGELLAPGGLLVLEHARRRPAPETAGRLVRVRQVTSGDSTLSFYELKTN